LIADSPADPESSSLRELKKWGKVVKFGGLKADRAAAIGVSSTATRSFWTSTPDPWLASWCQTDAGEEAEPPKPISGTPQHRQQTRLAGRGRSAGWGRRLRDGSAAGDTVMTRRKGETLWSPHVVKLVKLALPVSYRRRR
jgi:hypothetical protein